MKRFSWIAVLLLALALVLAACGGAAEQPPAEEPAAEEPAAEEPAAEEPAAEEPAAEEAAADTGGQYQIPAIEEDKYNVAFVYVGPHDDGGWTQAHDVGRIWVQENVENVHTAYVENVARALPDFRSAHDGPHFFRDVLHLPV